MLNPERRARRRTRQSSTWLASALLFAQTACPIAATPAPNTIEIVGNSGVSAQQMFLGQSGKVYIVDKTERNPLTVNGHPAWASEYDPETNQVRAMDIVTNTFCAGGNVLGNGTWINMGGNQAIGYGGLNVSEGAAPYRDYSGGKATRTLDTCADQTCDWTNDEANYMSTQRWYPSLETLEDGSLIVIGGCNWGGYVNDAGQNNPTYEFYPKKGGPVGLNILANSLPANLFVVTYLLPSGNVFINSNWQNEVFDYKNNVEYPLPDMPHAVRTYPGSAAVAMMPLTPANNWTATLMFCGGTNLQPDQWVTNWNIAAYPADQTCVSITPDVSPSFTDEQALPEPRVMGNFIFLPDGRLLLLNGIGKGTAGYGNTSWAIGQSFGDDPVKTIYYYDHTQPSGSRFSNVVTSSTVNRMYHSSATLMPDGSVLSSGSNPNADYVPEGVAGYPYYSEYRVERFYPDYYNETRPQPSGIPSSLSYGGQYFDIQLSSSDVGKAANLDNTKVVLIRPGFSTHAINFGQRYLQLDMSYTANSDGSATLHVAQVPPNPAILAPGPALLFVVVDGVPSNGTWITVGNGQLGTQQVSAASQLPAFSGASNGKNWNAGNATSSTSVSATTSSSSPASSTMSSSNAPFAPRWSLPMALLLLLVALVI